MKPITLTILLGLGTFALAACGSSPEPRKSTTPSVDPGLWGSRQEAPVWTASALSALDTHGAPLVWNTPADIAAYCPGYRSAGPDDRKAFWVTFLSALAKHESTWRPEAAGGGGAWLGLLQISPGTARGYGCDAQTAEALKDGSKNLSCGIRIMAQTVQRDGVISAGNGGVAADWAPFRNARKREDIQAKTRLSAACRS